jgi:hypothetical protein
MPMRVKCRCGHEVVVRYGDWVYALVALLALSLLLNSIVLVVLFLRLDETARAPEERRVGAPVATATPDGRNEALPSDFESGVGGLRKAPQRPAEESPKKPAAVGEHESPAAATAPTEAMAAPPDDETLNTTIEPSPDDREALVTLGGPEQPAPELVATLRGRSAVLPDSGDVAEESASEPRLLVDAPKLVRLFLLESGGAAGGLAYPLLLDPDPLIRTRALLRLQGSSVRSRDAPERVGVEHLLRYASGLPSYDGAHRSLQDFCETHFPSAREARGADPSGGQAAFLRLWTGWREEAEQLLRTPTGQALVARCEHWRAGGLELALLVDSSQSMEVPFRSLRVEMGWLLPAIGWMFPAVRGGLVLYADGVREARALESGLAESILTALSEADVQGGGDVPEDLHLAVREALSLGRLDWQPTTEKHLLVVGDAPPPYGQVKRLLLLLQQAREQGGFRLHTFGVAPQEERDQVPFFEALANAGGGCSHTLQNGAIGGEVFACLLGESVRPAVAPLLAALRGLFQETPHETETAR